MSHNFNQKIYQQLKKVPWGRVTTYKALAESLGSKAYRAVGTAMKNNPFAPQVPCHRVVTSTGSIGGYKGFKTGNAIKEKAQLLKKEGIIIKKGKIQNFQQVLLVFKKNN
jgi:methylated-DNA-[protein]-cysteine S-methyltransferase